MGTLTEVGVGVWGLVLFALALAVPSILRAFRRAITIEGPLPLGRVMQRCGVSPDDAAGRELDLVTAASRCASCKQSGRCEEWLASRRRSGVDAFCGNASLLRALKR